MTPDVRPAADDDRHLRVVALGASAGGLSALAVFFRALPAEVDDAFIVIPHLDPQHPNSMPRLLARHTAMPVRTIEDGATPSRSVVYVLPPGQVARLHDGRFAVRADDGGPRAMPIDRFFVSLAAECGRRACAIVLSGTGSDGARGIRAVHRSGGRVMAQVPHEARFDGMPRSALATGAVHHVDTVAALAAALSAPEIVDRDPDEHEPPDVSALDDTAVRGLVERLRSVSSLDFRQYSAVAVRAAVRARLFQRRIDLETWLGEFGEHGEGGELDVFRRVLLDPVSRFDADPHLFDVLETHLLPLLTQRLGADAPLRMWVPGCGTGEETCVLAMQTIDALTHRAGRGRLRVIATDVDGDALTHARRAIYTETTLDALDPVLRERFFEPVTGGGERLIPRVHQAIIYARHDLLRDAPFGQMDLVYCRGLLGVLRRAERARALANIHFALRPGGWLVVGADEDVESAGFELDNTRARIYRRLSPPPEAADQLARLRRDGAAVGDDDERLRERIEVLERQLEHLRAHNTELRALNEALGAHGGLIDASPPPAPIAAPRRRPAGVDPDV